jgi:class 3 adenylate cyclase/tetratricopeptide (TPR) repeat protein
MPDKWISEFKAKIHSIETVHHEAKEEIPKLRPGERKTVTVLFLDLKGFTAMSEKMDPEELHYIIDQCFKMFTKDIEKFGGYVDKYEGDCIMALFGAKKSSEFDAELGVRAALQMMVHLGEINQVLEEKNLKLGMRIGINSGLVVAGPVGKERAGDFTVYGDSVNLASRLESNAEVNTVLVSDEVYRQVKNKFDCVDKGTITVKGKSVPVHVFTIERECRQVLEKWERASIFDKSPFVGRVREVEQLRQSLAGSSVMEGSSPVHVLQGSPGVGKSRLLHYCVQTCWLDDPKHVSFKTRCIAYETPYYPFEILLRQGMEFLKSILGLEGEKEVVDKLGPELPDKERDIFLANRPVLENLLGIAEHELPHEDPKELQLKHLMSISSFFKALLSCSEKQGYQFVIIFDDIQWINSTSREAGLFFMDQVLSSSLKGIFIVSRDGYDWHKLIPPTKHSSAIHIGPLPESDCREMIVKTIGERTMPAVLTNTILNLCQGNPYFLEEIILSLYERSIIDFESGEWKYTGESENIPIPTTLESLLLSRVDCLPKKIKETIHIASVLGRRIDKHILTMVQERLGAEHEEAESNMDLLKRLDLLHEEQSEPEVLFFSQNLFHQVVYQSILKSNREILHELTAESYYRMAKGDDRFCSFIAHHYLHSAHPMLALKSLSTTVKQFVLQFRNEEARSFSDRGLELLKSKEEKEGLSGDENNMVWLFLTEKEKIAEILNDHQGRKETLERMLELAVQSEDPHKAAEVKNRSAYYAIHMGRYEDAIKEARDVLGLPGIEGSIYEANAIRYLGLSVFGLGDYNDAEKHIRHSLELREQLRDALGEARDLSSLSIVNWRHGEYEQAIGHLKRSMEIRKKRGDLRGLAHDNNNIGLIFLALGDLQTAKQNFNRALELYQQTGDRRGEGNTLSNLSLVLLHEDDMNSAVDYARRSLEFSQKYKLARLNINSRIYLAKILIEAEDKPDFEQVGKLLESALQDAGKTDYHQGLMEANSVKAELLRKCERIGEAYEISRQAVEVMKRLNTEDEEVLWTHYQVALGHDQKDEALSALKQAMEFIRERGKKIVDIEMQKMYITNNKIRRRIAEWHQKWFP